MDELLAALTGAVLGGAAVAWCVGAQLAQARRDNAVLEERVRELTAAADAAFEQNVDSALAVGGVAWRS